MVCQHLSELYQLCESNEIRIGGSDLVRLVCQQCNEVETCPSMLLEQYEEIEGSVDSFSKPSSPPADQ